MNNEIATYPLWKIHVTGNCKLTCIGLTSGVIEVQVVAYYYKKQNNLDNTTMNLLTLTCPKGWWGRCKINKNLPKGKGREGGEKNCNQRDRWGWGWTWDLPPGTYHVLERVPSCMPRRLFRQARLDRLGRFHTLCFVSVRFCTI